MCSIGTVERLYYSTHQFFTAKQKYSGTFGSFSKLPSAPEAALADQFDHTAYQPCSEYKANMSNSTWSIVYLSTIENCFTHRVFHLFFIYQAFINLDRKTEPFQ